MSNESQVVSDIRSFNRFYTGMIGLLNQHILDSNLSLSEVRVLYEIGQLGKCTAGQLISILKIDGGYLSRMLKKFEKNGWLTRQQSTADGRTFFLHLSASGKKMLAGLEEKSTGEIRTLTAPLSEKQQLQVAGAMKTIQQVLSAGEGAPVSDIHIRYNLLPGDVGYLIYLHGQLYARESGYNLEFEAYVCKTFYEFLPTYNPAKDRMFLAIADNQIVGSVAILGSSRHLAQLRWFLIHPDYRGRGLGKKLLEEALLFCREKDYQKVYLMTTSMQETAIALYKKAGFRKTGEKHLQLWGQQLYEQRYDMDLF
ncbi:bifunctional helix-turn-helix transcriptional regulator/GNAT family N-acetyltransferase [Chitinophaga sp. 22321]|uniref:Bifunctional helix-turn-helix transcriptional regulator/GNAT family N-acetyltransferase n=1 Tax=Chitinophaga hostae TaxID=2831022 RepID=A0ABS5J9L1_9BACT|nr:bifunctional helix-turn-helix transcriptional regulator/GNAT family N-acetyltransferase [Chitinophaga hostae]MBS0031913.1 bifunctional helix-turn-helix transcriptional regulator/GNAT family N-acetyltransferase [Chitinophaga hostae]